MGFRRSLALLVASTLLPLLLFSRVAVRQYGLEQNAAAERALADASSTLMVAVDKHFEATVAALRVWSLESELGDGHAVRGSASRRTTTDQRCPVVRSRTPSSIRTPP